MDNWFKDWLLWKRNSKGIKTDNFIFRRKFLWNVEVHREDNGL